MVQDSLSIRLPIMLIVIDLHEIRQRRRRASAALARGWALAKRLFVMWYL
ncbi:MAG: hypothetical protein VCF24_22260 [Candidatus Latescibacterota bacterium]|jgi:hypothetical protein